MIVRSIAEGRAYRKHGFRARVVLYIFSNVIIYSGVLNIILVISFFIQVLLVYN